MVFGRLAEGFMKILVDLANRVIFWVMNAQQVFPFNGY